MKQNVSIARALKEKSRLAGRIHTLTEVINHENSLAEGSTRSIDLKEALAQVKTLTNQMITLKASIARGNQDAIDKIVELI